MAGACYNSAISIEKVHDELGLETFDGSKFRFDILNDEAIRIAYPIEMSVWHPKYGFHSTLIVERDMRCHAIRVINFRQETTTRGWMWENLNFFVNDMNKEWAFRKFRLNAENVVGIIGYNLTDIYLYVMGANNGEILKKAILIVGMHKSGTSAMAGSLYHCGVAFGQYVSSGKPNENSYTLYENSIFIKVNDKILESFGCTAMDLRKLPSFETIAKGRKHVKTVEKWMRHEYFDQEDLFCIKDPRISLTMPYYLKALNKMDIKPYVIFMTRPCEEVIKSTKMQGQVKELCQSYKRRINEALIEFRPKSMIIDFQGFVDAPVEVLEVVEERFDIDLNLTENAEKVLGFVDKDRKHH